MKLFSLRLLSIVPALFGTAAFAQTYSPTVGDLNAIYDPPMNIQGIICLPYTDGNQLSICKDGVAAARWMAEKYAKQAGAYLGCVDGMTQGINAGFVSTQNPTDQMTRDAQNAYSTATFDTAVSRAQQQAIAEGQTVSADQVIQRYRAVIGRRDANGNQVLPDKSYQLPQNTFKGYEDGYTYDVLSKDTSVNAAIQAGWVTNASPWYDQTKAAKLYALQSQATYQACQVGETIFGRNSLPQLTLWDYFASRGKFNFETYGWNNADWAFDVLVKSENTLDTYMTFVQIDKQTKQVSTVVDIKETRPKVGPDGKAIPKLGADGKPVTDSLGRIVYETEEVITGHQTVVNTVPLTDAEKEVLRNAYRTGFKESYKRYYAKQYASLNYNTNGMDKYKTGFAIGSLVGTEVAQKTATKNAYDNAYKVSSTKAYAETSKARYVESFNHLIEIFAHNPVYELNTGTIFGQTPDNIFRAGEELYVQFNATNLGEVARPSTFSILGSPDVNANSGYSFSIPALSSGGVTTSTLGKVNDAKLARSQINVGFGLTNPGDLKEVARSLVVQKNQAITINDYLEIASAVPALDYVTGTLTTNIHAINPANSAAPLTVSKVEVNLGPNGSVQSSVLQVGGGGATDLVLNLNGIDPLSIILAGGVGGNVNSYVGDRLAHSIPITAGLGENFDSAFVRYFDALATGKSNNTGTSSKADRIAALITRFNGKVKADIARNIVWDDVNDVHGTFVGLIQRFYQEAKTAGRITPAAQNVYNQLGQTLIKNRDDVKAGGGIRFNREKNRKRFDSQIKVFANI